MATVQGPPQPHVSVLTPMFQPLLSSSAAPPAFPPVSWGDRTCDSEGLQWPFNTRAVLHSWHAFAESGLWPGLRQARGWSLSFDWRHDFQALLVSTHFSCFGKITPHPPFSSMSKQRRVEGQWARKGQFLRGGEQGGAGPPLAASHLPPAGRQAR